MELAPKYSAFAADSAKRAVVDMTNRTDLVVSSVDLNTQAPRNDAVDDLKNDSDKLKNNDDDDLKESTVVIERWLGPLEKWRSDQETLLAIELGMTPLTKALTLLEVMMLVEQSSLNSNLATMRVIASS